MECFIIFAVNILVDTILLNNEDLWSHLKYGIQLVFFELLKCFDNDLHVLVLYHNIFGVVLLEFRLNIYMVDTKFLEQTLFNFYQYSVEFG